MLCNICCNTDVILYNCSCNYNICFECITNIYKNCNYNRCPMCHKTFDWINMYDTFGSNNMNIYIQKVFECDIIRYKKKQIYIGNDDGCPRCAIPVIKDEDGCHHVICTNCNLNFNWKNKIKLSNNTHDEIIVPHIVDVSNACYVNPELRKYKICMIKLHEYLLHYIEIHDIIKDYKLFVKSSLFCCKFFELINYLLRIIIDKYISFLKNDMNNIQIVYDVTFFIEKLSTIILLFRLSTQRYQQQ